MRCLSFLRCGILICVMVCIECFVVCFDFGDVSCIEKWCGLLLMSILLLVSGLLLVLSVVVCRVCVCGVWLMLSFREYGGVCFDMSC